MTAQLLAVSSPEYLLIAARVTLERVVILLPLTAAGGSAPKKFQVIVCAECVNGQIMGSSVLLMEDATWDHQKLGHVVSGSLAGHIQQLNAQLSLEIS